MRLQAYFTDILPLNSLKHLGKTQLCQRQGQQRRQNDRLSERGQKDITFEDSVENRESKHSILDQVENLVNE